MDSGSEINARADVDSLEGLSSANDPGQTRNPAIVARKIGSVASTNGKPPPYGRRDVSESESLPSTSSAVTSPALSREAQERWGSAVGNMHDLGLVVANITKTLEEAVYMDPEPYAAQTKIQKQAQVIKAREDRIAALEAELDLTCKDLSTARSESNQFAEKYRNAEATISTLRQEQENNAVVFKMHFSELISKEDIIKKQAEEIEKLKGILEVLQGNKAQE